MRIRTQRLPTGYRELEYIESTGTQYIDSGYNYLESTEVNVVTELVGTSNNQYACIFGTVGNSNTNPGFALFVPVDSFDSKYISGRFGYWEPGQTMTLSSDVIWGTNIKHTIICKVNYLKVDNSSPITASMNYQAITRTIKLFARGGYDSDIFQNAYARCRMYCFKIKDATGIIRNFIPAERCSDNKPGLYDIVNDVFYVNQGTGEFIKGPYIDGFSGKISTLYSIPSGYTELEYIESNGGSYINTNLVGQSGYTIESEISFNALSTGSYQYFAGFSYTGSANRVYYFRLNNSSATYGYTYGSNNSDTTNLATLSPNVFYKLKAVMEDGNQQSYLNNNLLGSSNYSLTGVDLQSPKYIYMFTSQYVNGTNGPTVCKCKYVKWYFNGKLVRDYIPLKRNSDNVVGMFDKITRTFFTNAGGSGSFIAGPNKITLPANYQQVEWILNEGNSYIDTGWKPNFNVTFKIEATVIPTQEINSNNRLGILSSYNGNDTSVILSSECSGNNSYRFYAQNELDKSIQGVIPYKENKLVTFFNGASSFIEANGKHYAFDASSLSGVAVDSAYIFKDRLLRTLFKPFKLCEMNITENDILVHNFIPCYRKSDGKIGIYDTVNDSFKINGNTDQLYKGPNVNNIISCKVAGGSSDIYYGYNQLIQNGDFSIGSTNWDAKPSIVSWTQNNNIAEVTIIKDVATASNAYTSRIMHSSFNVVINHKYLAICQVKTNNYAKMRFSLNLVGGQDQSYIDVNTANGDWVVASRFYNNTSLTQMRISTYPRGSLTQGTKYYVKNVILIDLTDWYGAGKEPSTVAEFKEKFTKEYYGTCLTPIKLTRYQIEALPNYGYNQLIQNGDFSSSSGWGGHQSSTLVVNNNIASVTAPTSAIAGNFGIARSIPTTIIGHKVLTIFTARTSVSSCSVRLRFPAIGTYKKLTSEFKTFMNIATVEGSTLGIFLLQCVTSLYPAVVQFKNCMLIDLTDWYGEGNEPTTVEEFKETFPNKYYPYSKKRLLNKYMINKLES